MTDAPGRLRAAGLRVTSQRVAILDALAALGGHPTADEVAAALIEGSTDRGLEASLVAASAEQGG